MARMSMRAPAAALIAASLSCVAGVARAHAPLSRGIALSRAPSGSGALAVRMPGFGLIARAGEGEPFAYACDALLGLQPTDEQAPFVALADGSWLVGTNEGLRALTASGCPKGASPSGIVGAPIRQLAVAPGDPSIAYAITGDPAPAIFRSDDGGQSWTKRAELEPGQPIRALLVADDDADAVYVSASTGAMQSALLVSHDGGGAFDAHPQTRELTLLDVREEPLRLIARAQDGAAARGAQIYRATALDGEWQSILALDFFGGFARAADGTLFVGDEAGSVFRSSDGGDSFVDLHPETATACLASAGETLWACTPGLTTMRAVATLSTEQPTAELQDVVALADVDHLAECGAELDVAAICASAWIEWSLDVRGVVPEPSDAGMPRVDPEPTTDAATAEPDAGDAAAATPEAGAEPPAAEPPKAGDGCSLVRPAAPAPPTAGWALFALYLATALRRARARRLP